MRPPIITGALLLALGPATLSAVAQVAEPAAARLDLAESGRSAYVIYHDEKAPATVKLAAEEIQRVIAVSTGVKLPIVNQPVSPMICLGDTPPARSAGFSAEALPDDAFRLFVKDGNLYIAGKDTPDNFKWKGWESRGTLYGAYEFLETAVGVRWLMPGDVGEEIPSLKALAVPVLDRTVAPSFSARSLVDVQNQIRSPDPKDKERGYLAVDRWLLRQKCANASDAFKSTREKIPHGHAWGAYIKPDDYKAHPEFQAVSGGRGKFCTSNPEVVALFAQRVIEYLDRHPERRAAAISPEDGGDFCKCPKCTALTTKDWHGNVSYTPVILKFYNDVAAIVAGKHPDRFLGGYVYYNYMYPPDAKVRMEPNVYLSLAPLDYYGWGLAKPQLREEFPKLISAWMAITPNFGYGSWSAWFRSLNGTPLPPGLPLLKQELPTLSACGVKSVWMVGIGAWGYGGAQNYITVKLMWDSHADVDALYREWLQKAYGPAWPAMRQFYSMIEDRVLERKRNESPKYSGDNYEVNHDFVDTVYKPVFPEMERLYRLALSQAATEKQRKRLEMLGDNLVMLHYCMRKANMLKDSESSVFYRSDDAYVQFLRDTEFSLSMYRDHGHRDTPLLFHGSFSGQAENPPMEIRKLVIPRLPAGVAPPVLDGDLSDPAWKTAVVASEFRKLGGRDLAKQQTVARLTYDAAALYIAFSCSESQPGRIQKTASVRDSNDVWADDVVEIMMAVFPDARHQFWHLALTPANVQWTGIVRKLGQNLPWKSATRVTGDGWTAEIAIPFQGMGMKEAPAGKTWPAALDRSEKPSGENSTWNAAYRGFMEPYSFGEWTFAP